MFIEHAPALTVKKAVRMEHESKQRYKKLEYTASVSGG